MQSITAVKDCDHCRAALLQKQKKKKSSAPFPIPALNWIFFKYIYIKLLKIRQQLSVFNSLCGKLNINNNECAFLLYMNVMMFADGGKWRSFFSCRCSKSHYLIMHRCIGRIPGTMVLYVFPGMSCSCGKSWMACLFIYFYV